jgi:hypothetical protein
MTELKIMSQSARAVTIFLTKREEGHYKGGVLMVEISEGAITVRADTISLTVISLIITDRDTFLTIMHQLIALAGIRGVLEVESEGRP